MKSKTGFWFSFTSSLCEPADAVQQSLFIEVLFNHHDGFIARDSEVRA
jgi:hypothetical protein